MVGGKNNLICEVNRWLSDTFENEHFKNINAEITGTTEKGDGYLGDIVFVKVYALTFDEETILFNLVIKYGKQVEGLREKLPVRLAFEREIFVYSKAVPIFRQFEEERNITTVNTFLPQCFNTLLYDKQEVIVFQNLKAIGYNLHSRYEPLDINHLELTFGNYGRWHGLAMAYRDQKSEDFDKLFGNLECVMAAFIPQMKLYVEEAGEGLYAVLKSNNELDLLERLRERFQKGVLNGLLELLNTNEENCVFVHGDCWNNNMMFKYDEQDNQKPISAVFLDFQLSRLASPVYDLAYHLYSTSSEKELLHFKDLLRTYYSSLSNTLKQLGSDPDKVFPYSELVRQWRKYSYGGLIMASLCLPICLTEKEDTPDIQLMGEERFSEILEKLRLKNNDRLSARMIPIVKHLLDFDDF